MKTQVHERARGTNKRLSCVIGLALACLFGLGRLSTAQGLNVAPGADSPPSVGGTGAMRPPAQLHLFNGSQNTAKMHLGPTGKPCLSVQGYGQQQAVNPNIFTHMITVSNDCSQAIKVQVCYYQSEQCRAIDVPGYAHKETPLGIMPAMKDFRFEYREQFDQGSGFGGAGAPFN
jgi:hypothetical protein